MKVKTIKDMNAVHPEDYPPKGVVPAGTVLEGDGMYRLIQAGVADAVDEEARVACGMDDAEIKIAKLRQRRTSAGIAPEDYDAYDQGLMVGYNPDGSWKPGPNAETATPEDEYDQDDYDEDVNLDENPETEEEITDE